MVISTFILLKSSYCQCIRRDLLTRLRQRLYDVQSGPGAALHLLEKCRHLSCILHSFLSNINWWSPAGKVDTQQLQHQIQHQNSLCNGYSAMNHTGKETQRWHRLNLLGSLGIIFLLLVTEVFRAKTDDDQPLHTKSNATVSDVLSWTQAPEDKVLQISVILVPRSTSLKLVFRFALLSIQQHYK